MKLSLLTDEKNQEALDDDGFVKIQLLDAADIQRLESLRRQYFPDEIDSFFSSSYLNSFEQKQEISSQIIGLLQEKIATCFQNHRLLGAAFLIKGNGKKSEMPMHQDWTIVDETKYSALNFWVPLVETSEENGCLELLKGSHRKLNYLRSPSLPMAFRGNEELLKSRLTAVPTKLGEVVVINQSTVHYSKPNLSGAQRPALTCGIVSEEAPLQFHFFKEGKVEQFLQTDDFLLKFENFHQSIFERPKIGSVSHTFDYEPPILSATELMEKFPLPKKRSFLSKLLSW